MKKKLFAFVIAGFLSISGTAFAIDISDEGYIEAEGYGEANQSPGVGRRSAVMDAYRYLAEQIDDLHITSSTTVKQSRTVNDEINTEIDSVLRGAKIISTYQDKKGGYHAIARLSVYGAQNVLARAVLKNDYQIMDFPEPKYTNTESSNISTTYTGIIIDCRGLGLSTAVSPSIKTTDGEQIYSYQNLDYNLVVGKGMVEYSHKINAGVERAGHNPLTIKAVSVSNACDPVIRPEDALKILSTNKQTGILNKCNVVFVR